MPCFLYSDTTTIYCGHALLAMVLLAAIVPNLSSHWNFCDYQPLSVQMPSILIDGDLAS
jgi:hypothetical protein